VSGVGNRTLWKATKWWLGNSERSVAHNVKVLQRYLARWGRDQISAGNVNMWNQNAREMERQSYKKNKLAHGFHRLCR